jgi:hypothetical protein
MPLKLGLPPTLAGRTACAWPDVRVMDMEMTALTAATAMATVIIEPERRSSMMASLCNAFTLSHFRTENRIPLFLKMLPLALSHFRTENRIPLFLKMLRCVTAATDPVH